MRKIIIFLVIATSITACSKKSSTGTNQQNQSLGNALTLQVKGRNLTDTNGNTILLRGVNVAFYGGNDIHGNYQEVNLSTINNIASIVRSKATKCNAVRLLWLSQAAGGTSYSLNNLDSLLTAYTNQNFIPVVYLWDITKTGANTTAGFTQYIVPFWNDPNVVTLLKKYQNKIIINLANEWGHTNYGDGNDVTPTSFTSTYNGLITQIRNNGINCPIMVDAPDGGTNSQFLIDNGASIVNSDPKKNILLSTHTYWGRSYSIIATSGCSSDYITKIDAIKNSNLPFVIGEASNWADPSNSVEALAPIPFDCSTISQNLNAALSPNNADNPIPDFNNPPSPNQNTNILFAVNYDVLLTQAVTDGVGYFAWAWYQDGLTTRCIYDHDNGTTLNTDSRAGTWPADILSSSKTYGLNHP
jgi:hypothetical protein